MALVTIGDGKMRKTGPPRPRRGERFRAGIDETDKVLTSFPTVLYGRLPEYVTSESHRWQLCRSRQRTLSKATAPQLAVTLNKLLTWTDSGWCLRRRLEDCRCPH
jgi:uncharacterized protein YciW